MTNETIIELLNFIKQLGLIAIGAIIPTISTYITFRRREKVIIKLHIQSMSAEGLTKNIKDCIRNLNNLKTNLFPLYENYNRYKKEENNRFSKKIEVQIIDCIFKEINIKQNYWKNYLESVEEIITTLETKEIIFHKLNKYKRLFFSSKDIMTEKYKRIESLYYEMQMSSILCNKGIEEEKLKALQGYELEFINLIKENLKLLNELSIALQNQFYKKLFRYNLSNKSKKE